MGIGSNARFRFRFGFLFFAMSVFAACRQNLCDMTPDGSVWLTVARLSFAEQKFHKLQGRYGELVEMTNLLDGLPPDVIAGRMGSYVITIKLTNNGYVLRANPEFRHGGRRPAAFYGDQTGITTFNRSGKPAGPDDEKM